MNRGNKLWEGHRLLLPELREKAITLCRHCLFMVSVVGREETKTGCLVSVKEYGTLRKRVPREIHAAQLIRQVGREGLEEIITRGANPDTTACGLFLPHKQGDGSAVWAKQGYK